MAEYLTDKKSFLNLSRITEAIDSFDQQSRKRPIQNPKLEEEKNTHGSNLCRRARSVGIWSRWNFSQGSPRCSTYQRHTLSSYKPSRLNRTQACTMCIVHVTQPRKDTHQLHSSVPPPSGWGDHHLGASSPLPATCTIAHLCKFSLTFYGTSIPFYNAITEVKWLFITTMISPANDILNSRKEATTCRGVKVDFVHRLAESWYWWQKNFCLFCGCMIFLCFCAFCPWILFAFFAK